MMSDTENWGNPLEDDGITLGPEEALRREIEKSKNLKVERLKLRDEIEKLRAKNQALEKQIQTLTRSSGGPNFLPAKPPSSQPKPPFSPPVRWSVFLLIFNLLAMALLLYFLYKNN